MSLGTFNRLHCCVRFVVTVSNFSFSFRSGDEVWRPGAMDEDAAQSTENADMWGAGNSNEQNTFGSPANDADGKFDCL